MVGGLANQICQILLNIKTVICNNSQDCTIDYSQDYTINYSMYYRPDYSI